MGHGASCTKVEQFHESIQVPSPSKRSSTSSSLSPSYKVTPPKVPTEKPPPLVSIQEEGFKVKRNTDQYASIWDFNAKLSSIFQEPLKGELAKIKHHQKETMNTKWTKKSSTDLASTHVESTLNTQTHSCINLSTSEKIDDAIKNLNRIHTQLDESIKRRTQQISAETESVLAHIMNETQQEQQRLLSYAKEQQTTQDEHYRESLQQYISQLNEIKARELTQLQEELQQSREQIMQVSQSKIMAVNDQANIIKSKIVKEEQQQASMKIEVVSTQLQSYSTDETFQQLGSEIMTKTSVITNANVGTKIAGQNCSFDLVQDVLVENRNTDEHAKQGYTKTTNSEKKIERRVDQEEIVSQIEKKISVNSRLPRQNSK